MGSSARGGRGTSQHQRRGRRGAASRNLPLRTRPWWTLGILLCADLLAFAAALGVALAMAQWTWAVLPQPFAWIAAGAALLFVLLCWKLKLYPGVAMAPAQELRKLTLASALADAGLLMVSLWSTDGRLSAVILWAVSWMTLVILLCLTRVLVYHHLSQRSWWGYPVVLIGKAQAVAPVIRTLRLQPLLGLTPVAVLDSSKRRPAAVEGVPVLGGLEQAHRLRTRFNIRYAILAARHGLNDELAQRLGDRVEEFPHLLMIPKGFQAGHLTAVRNLGGVFSVELAQRLLRPANQYFKAAVDTMLAAVLTLFSLPLLAVIAVLIKLDSKGAVFYEHPRIGLGGRRFKALKFRTMVPDADRILARYLQAHPELRDEWERSHKLRNDPRVTRVGRLLRKPSLDELPQLWNVLRGEMSVIGPRPIVEDEVKHYNRSFSLYKKVKPGISGLWQVSGRSDTTYRERVCLDVYYVRNWSIWLDCYILARTLAVVLFGRGAY